MNFKEYLSELDEALKSNFSTEEKKVLRKQLNDNYKKTLRNDIETVLKKTGAEVGSFIKPKISFYKDTATLMCKVETRLPGFKTYTDLSINFNYDKSGSLQGINTTSYILDDRNGGSDYINYKDSLTDLNELSSSLKKI